MLPITATIFKFAAATSATKEITSFGIDKANILFNRGAHENFSNIIL